MKRWFGVWLAIFPIYAAVDMASGALLLRGVPAPPHHSLPFSLLADALLAVVSTALAARLEGRGPLRALVLFALPFGVQANGLLELTLFPLSVPGRLIPFFFLQLFVIYAAAALALDAIAPPGTAGPPRAPSRRSVAGWIGRVLACDLGYVVTYAVAGMIAWQFVRPFYSHQSMPSPVTLLQLQILRGLVLTALLALLALRLRAPRGTLVLLGGLALSVFGASPLLVPTAYMPDFVRLAHLCEVGLSNFAYGCAATALLVVIRRVPVADATRVGG